MEQPQNTSEKFAINTETNKFTVSKFTLREILFKYLSYLPLFLFSLIVCVGWGILYVRYAVPVYRATANMYVKANENASSGNDLVEQALFGGKRVNIDNEMELIKSKKNLLQVVKKYHFNITYYNEGAVKKTNTYFNSPFILQPVVIKDSNSAYAFYVKEITKNGGLLFKSLKQDVKTGKPFKWGQTIDFANMQFQLQPRNADAIANMVGTNSTPYFVLWSPCLQKASEIRGGLTVAPFSAKTSIIQLTLITSNADEGKDVLNGIITEYNAKSIEDKSVVSANTINFIEDRLKLVSAELKDIGDSLNEYKVRNGLLDVKADANALGNSSGGTERSSADEAKKTEKDFALKVQLLNDLEEYMKSPVNKYNKVPSLFEIGDATLGALIGRFNEIQLSRQLLKSEVLANNMRLAQITAELDNVRQNLFESINVVRKTYKQRLYEARNDKTLVSGVPAKMQGLLELQRQLSVKQSLYVYLLQKREETAIASSSPTSNYQQVDFAEASYSPIDPKAAEVRNYSILLGLIIPIVIIYVRDLFNDKLTNRDDISKRTKITIAGEISHVDNIKGNIVVVGESRSIIAEQFRVLRSNLQFLTKARKDATTYLISSSVSGEGKSFISLNVAGVLSLSNKKVALLEFDLRKMRSGKHTGELRKDKGIVNYLIGQIDDPEELISPFETLPNLHLFYSGPIAPNPGELIMTERVGELFTWLKARYDYIVIDSAPVGLVSDSFALVQYSDAVLYVARQRYTFKRQIDFLEEIRVQEKLKNIALIVNDVHMGNRYGYYGYGYGYGYGAYRYRYGYGYAYGGNYFGKKKKMEDGYFDMPGKNKKS